MTSAGKGSEEMRRVEEVEWQEEEEGVNWEVRNRVSRADGGVRCNSSGGGKVGRWIRLKARISQVVVAQAPVI
jgi:hypothetical protein